MIQVAKFARSFKYVATTPKKITPEILAFCRDEIGQGLPLYIPVAPTPEAAPGQCYFNVLDEIERQGGEMQIGWLIWELPDMYLTAERHAVVDRSGRFVDLTPAVGGERRVLFVPTDEDGIHRIPNKYRALANHPLLERFIHFQARNQSLWSDGELDPEQFRRNDAEATLALDRYRSLMEARREKARLRAKKKARGRR